MAAEKNFENRVKKYLDEYGCWWLKYWGGAAYTKSGIPDLLVSSDGCFLGIEVKADDGEPSLIQLYHLILESYMPFIPQLANLKLVTDTGVLAGELAPAMNEELVRIFDKEGR